MLRVLVLLALVAAIIYAVFWLLSQRVLPPEERRTGRSGGAGPRTPGGPANPPWSRRRTRPPPRPRGPDDDEDFLRDLDRRQGPSDR